MSNMRKVVILLTAFFFVVAGIFLVGSFGYRAAHAQETQEIKPYVFAELPHGRIYKAVHEGCELFITENDFQEFNNQYGQVHFYTIATGRGCK